MVDNGAQLCCSDMAIASMQSDNDAVHVCRAPTAWSSTWSMATQGTVDSEDEEGTQPERTLRRILITRIQG